MPLHGSESRSAVLLDPVSLLLPAAGATAALSALALALMAVSPSDADGAPTGALSTVGSCLLILLVITGTGLALRWRGDLFPRTTSEHIAALNHRQAFEADVLARTGAARVEQALAARRRREHYRSLAADDPLLAREVGVGLAQPDGVDDGGLIDVNRVEVGVLVDALGLSFGTAEEIVELRVRRGGWTSVDELIVFAHVPPDVEHRLREYAVFL